MAEPAHFHYAVRHAGGDLRDEGGERADAVRGVGLLGERGEVGVGVEVGGRIGGRRVGGGQSNRGVAHAELHGVSS